MADKTIYEQAAEQAEKDIPEAEREVADLQQQLAVAMQRLNNLRNIAIMGKFAVPAFVADAAITPAQTDSAYIKISKILIAAGVPMTAAQLSAAHKEHFNEAIPNSTLYFAVNKGLAKGTITQHGNTFLRKK